MSNHSLYKIEFNRPCSEAKASIWSAMIPALSHDEASQLGRIYDLSGGQIENGARKFTINHILNGDSEPTIEVIHKLCAAESLRKTGTHTRVGF